MAETQEATPLRRVYAIPAAVIVILCVGIFLIFNSQYVLLSQESVRGVLVICITLIGCTMVAEFTMRSRHRVVVGFVGGLGLLLFLIPYVMSYDPNRLVLSYWLGLADTMTFFLIFAVYALRK